MSYTNTRRSWMPKSFQLMAKPRGSICNLDCTYCYFLSKEKMYPDSSFTMSDELLENYTRQYIQAQQVKQVTFAWQGGELSDELLENYTRQYIQAQQVKQVTFAWQGGEPTLMGLDFYYKAVEFQRKYALPGMV